jgi:hypothetical protein
MEGFSSATAIGTTKTPTLSFGCIDILFKCLYFRTGVDWFSTNMGIMGNKVLVERWGQMESAVGDTSFC